MSVIPAGFVAQNGYEALAVALGRAIDDDDAPYEQAREALSIGQTEAIGRLVKAAHQLAETYKAAEGSPQHAQMEYCLQQQFKQDLSPPLRRALGGIFNELDCYLFSPIDRKYS